MASASEAAALGTLIQRTLRAAFPDARAEVVRIARKADHAGDPGLFVDVVFHGAYPSDARAMLDALLAVQERLAADGEEAFPYVSFHPDEDEAAEP